MLHVAIIGSSGFVGAALKKHLSGLGDVRVSALARPDFDLSRAETFSGIGDDVDVVVHAAGAIGADRPIREFWDVNVISTYELVSYLNSRERPPRLMYLSTGAVTGEADGLVDGGAEPRPAGPYALTKYLAEEVILKSYAGASSILRLYFPYGPGQGMGRLVPNLVRKIRDGEPVYLNDAGRPVISMVYIDDLVSHLEKMIRVPVAGVLSVAGTTRVRISELVSVIEEVVGRPAVRQATGKAVLDFCAGDCIGGMQTSLREGIRSVWDSLEAEDDRAVSQ